VQEVYRNEGGEKRKIIMFKKIISGLIVIWVASRCIDEVLYEYYLQKGDKLKAWLTRPIHGFKMYWID
jgi:hypothetical protein